MGAGGRGQHPLPAGDRADGLARGAGREGRRVHRELRQPLRGRAAAATSTTIIEPAETRREAHRRLRSLLEGKRVQPARQEAREHPAVRRETGDGRRETRGEADSRLARAGTSVWIGCEISRADLSSRLYRQTCGVSQGRKVRSDVADSSSGRFDTGKHRGRGGETVETRVLPFSAYGARIGVPSFELLLEIAHENLAV